MRVRSLTTRGSITTFIQRPLCIRRLFLSERRVNAVRDSVNAGRFALYPVELKLHSSRSKWVRGKMYGLSTFYTSRGWGIGILVFAETSSQRRGLRENRDRIWSLCAAFSFSFLLFVFVCEKWLQNWCAAPWLWSSMSTLWAPISATMTGTSMNDIKHPNTPRSLFELLCSRPFSSLRWCWNRGYPFSDYSRRISCSSRLWYRMAVPGRVTSVQSACCVDRLAGSYHPGLGAQRGH